MASIDIRFHPLYYMGMDSVTNTARSPRKTKPKGRHPDKALSAAFVRTAPPGRHADGNGLYLYVQPTGTRSWIQRLVIRGRKRELGLGSVALVSLAEAREQALANRKLARSGGDPLAEKRRSVGIPTFAEAARRVVEQKRAGWRSRAQGRDWMLTFERYAFPRVGKLPVSQVTSADMLEILAPIWHTKAATARKLRQRLHAVLEWAVAMELRIDNPCDRIGPVLGPQHNVVQHMRALPHREVAAAIRTARASTVPPAVRLAFEFLVLTAARWGEVRWAEWTEIDRENGVWTVPAKRMKSNREHRVPLCGRPWRFLTRHGSSWREPARSCFPIGSVSSSRRSSCAGCSGSTGSRPCRTVFAPVSGTGRPRKRIIRARSSRQPWRTSSRTESRQPIGVRTCSSAGVGS